MHSNRETGGADTRSAIASQAGALTEARRAAQENAAQIANAACLYALSVNSAWLELVTSHLDEYLELPKRFLEAQIDFLDQAFEGF